jgi:hypothetical protein
LWCKIQRNTTGCASSLKINQLIPAQRAFSEAVKQPSQNVAKKAQSAPTNHSPQHRRAVPGADRSDPRQCGFSGFVASWHSRRKAGEKEIKID